MIFLISLIYSVLFATLFHKYIKKWPYLFYSLALIASILVAYMGYTHMFKNVPHLVKQLFTSPIKKGSISFALFTVVMFIGALSNKNKWAKSMKLIRAELSIIASVFALTHVFIYNGIEFSSAIQNIGLLSGKLALIIMIPLFITSFYFIKKMMNLKNWKKLQKLSYAFYTLVYIHVIAIYLINFETHKLSILTYSIVFISYSILKIKKARF